MSVSAVGVLEGDAVERATRVAADVAALWADEVDRDARFPVEAVDALRGAALLSCAVPRHRGGEGASLPALCRMARILGRHCAATGMVFAMHQSQVMSLVRHGDSAAMRDFVDAAVGAQYLLASATTEVGIGGDVRRSSCAIEMVAGRATVSKNAPVISYGEYADAVLVTARRTPDSPASDQVLVVCRRSDVELEPTGAWNTLGLRGTCSPGFALHASTEPGLICTDPYSEISSETMLPVSHCLWSAVWLGIADAAMDKARRFVQSAGRRDPGVVPPGALRLAESAAAHQQMVDLVDSAAVRFERAARDPDDTVVRVPNGVGFALAMNNLKVSTSNLVVDIVGQAMLICGIAGYREDGKYSLGRHLRDAYGARVMVNNDRITANSAQLALAYRGAL